MNTKIKPLGDRVLVKPADEGGETKNGIIIPDTAKEKPQEGHVISLGDGGRDEKGNRTGFTVREGDRVLYSKYGGTEVKLEGEPYLIIREEDLLAVVGGQQ